jgi:hypothetical protein
MAKPKVARNTTSQKRALLVGINQYPGAPLKGCVNDAIMMGKILIEHFGFTPGGNMRLLVDQRATKNAILERLQWLVNGARPGDVLVFHYSGHGAQVPDRSDDEVDRLDECICPIDHDWDHPLSDDDLAGIIGSVSPGVNLTVILDCCHSGTGTRVCLPQQQLLGPETIKRLIPPPDLAFRAVEDIAITPGEEYFSVTMRSFRNLSVRRFGETVAQNAILIAGCRPDQLSKDAYIDGDYHGALTYSLYQALERLGSDASYSQWLAETAKVLKGHYIADQDPQLECPDEMAAWRLFSIESAPRAKEPIAPVLPNKYVVYVHGIGPHLEGFSDPWWEAMQPFVHSIPPGNRREVCWSDLVNSTARAGKQPVSEQAEVTEAIRETLMDRAQRQMAAAMRTHGGTRGYEDLERRAFLGIPGLDHIDDFVKYLLQRRVRDQVIDRFLQVVRPLLRSGNSVEVISHSWGTVVAYEALRLLDEASGDGTVVNFFTVGSALSIPVVKRLLLPEAVDGRRPRAVRRWINLDAQFDIVGGPLQGVPFGVDLEFLQLAPVGCEHPALNPACAHGSYFHPDNLAVNRDIFGRYIETVPVPVAPPRRQPVAAPARSPAAESLE